MRNNCLYYTHSVYFDDESDLKQITREITVRTPYTSSQTEDVIEEIDNVIDFYDKEKIAYISKIEKNFCSTFNNFISQYTNKYNIENMKDFIEIYKKVPKTVKSKIQEEISELKYDLEKAKRADNMLWKEEAQEELDIEYNKKIKVLSDDYNFFQEDYNSLLDLYDEEVKKKNEFRELNEEQKQEELKPLLIELDKLEKNLELGFQKKLVALVSKIRTLDVRDIEQFSDKNVEDVNIYVKETFDYWERSGKDTQIYEKHFDNFQDFENAYGVMATRINTAEVNKETKRLKQMQKDKNKVKDMFLEYQIKLEENSMFLENVVKFVNKVESVKNKVKKISSLAKGFAKYASDKLYDLLPLKDKLISGRTLEELDELDESDFELKHYNRRKEKRENKENKED